MKFITCNYMCYTTQRGWIRSQEILNNLIIFKTKWIFFSCSFFFYFHLYNKINSMKIHVLWIAMPIHTFTSLTVKLHLIYYTCKHQKVSSTQMIYEIYTQILRGISSVFDLWIAKWFLATVSVENTKEVWQAVTIRINI